MEPPLFPWTIVAVQSNTNVTHFHVIILRFNDHEIES